MLPLKIVVNGDLGSGKSQLARGLAEKLGARYVSSGALQRGLARDLGISTLEMNLRAEGDPSIDRAIDGELTRLSDTNEPLVIDARLAFHFVKGTTSLHLLAHPVTAARRVLPSREDAAEVYVNEDDAVAKLYQRRALERARFLDKYGVEIDRIANYDLVIQTDLCTENDVLGTALEFISTNPAPSDVPAAHVYLNPKAIFPTQDIRETFRRPLEPLGDEGDCPPIDVLSVDGLFYVLDGHKRLASTIMKDRCFIRARVLSQDDQASPFAISSRHLAGTSYSPSRAYDWEDALKFRFSFYPMPAETA